jgi:hypothetical protein
MKETYLSCAEILWVLVVLPMIYSWEFPLENRACCREVSRVLGETSWIPSLRACSCEVNRVSAIAGVCDKRWIDNPCRGLWVQFFGIATRFWKVNRYILGKWLIRVLGRR